MNKQTYTEQQYQSGDVQHNIEHLLLKPDSLDRQFYNITLDLSSL